MSSYSILLSKREGQREGGGKRERERERRRRREEERTEELALPLTDP
jgi:hypothetical protein